MARFIFFVTLLASAAAFNAPVVPKQTRWVSSRKAASMTVQQPNFEKLGKSLVAAAPIVLAALPVLATEGTGEVRTTLAARRLSDVSPF